MVGVWESGGDTSINVKCSIEDCFEHLKKYLELHTPSRQCVIGVVVHMVVMK